MPDAPRIPIATPSLPPTVLARWQFDTADASPTIVLPDGCSDLILHVDRHGQSRWHVSALADAAMQVPGCPGEHWLGYRLQPGASIDTAVLLQSVQSLWQEHQRRTQWACCHRLTHDMPHLEALVLEAIDRHTGMDPRAQEALQALAHIRTVGAAAQSLGVSERSLERLTQRATGRPPRFWRALARVRRAAQELDTARPLAEIAADHGYADQAHFSRDCLRWLGQTPAALRRTPERLATVAQAGYG